MKNKTILITGGTTGIGLATAKLLSAVVFNASVVAQLGFDAATQKGFEDSMAAQSLFKRFGTPEEVAPLARFLLSEESRYIVGENVTVDGGVRLT